MSAVAAAGAQVLAAIRDLLGFGYGSTRFEVAHDGSVRYLGSNFTVKARNGETPTDLISRLRAECDLRPGDTFELISEAGRISYARITRQPR